jgi:hypothetical protein
LRQGKGKGFPFQLWSVGSGYPQASLEEFEDKQGAQGSDGLAMPFMFMGVGRWSYDKYTTQLSATSHIKES